MTPDQALEQLLSELYTLTELRRLVRGAPALAALEPEVTWEGVPKTRTLDELVQLLRRHSLVDVELFTLLLRSRPRRAAEIALVAAAWGCPLTPAQVQATTASPADPLAALSRAEQVAALEELLLVRDLLSPSGRFPPDMGERIDALVSRIMAGGRPKAGDTVAGARLLKPIGNGNFGTIWLADDAEGRSCAVKVFHLEKLAEGVMLWRFRRSIRAMRQLAQDQRTPRTIARLIQVEPDTLALSMPYLEGGNLETVAQKGWSLPSKLSIFLEICQAVAFAHQIGIIHRDIKPTNVVLDADGRPVLTDFDLSDIKFATKLSKAGGLGTPIFAAPEQLEQGDLADERSDVYALGRLLHFLLLERSPGYPDERDPSLAALSPFPAALVAVVRRACQWDPRRRYPDVPALIRDVEQCQSGLAAVKAHLRRGLRWVKYNWILLSIAGLISAGSLGGYVSQAQKASVEAEKARVEAQLRQQLGEAVARIDALSKRQEELATRGITLATQLAALDPEYDGLIANRDALPEGDAGRAGLQTRIDALADQIGSIQAEQAKIAADQKTLSADLSAARARVDRAQKGEVLAVEAVPTEGSPETPTDGSPATLQDAVPAWAPSISVTLGPEGRHLAIWNVPDAPMTFVELPGGTFQMGSPSKVGSYDEHPQHAVTLSGFWVGQSEVTQTQWAAVVRAAHAAGDADATGLAVDPARYKGGTRPVEEVSWCASARFANAASRLEGLQPAYTVGSDCEAGGAVGWDLAASGFRLPTEAEWEYAARAGTETDWSFGDDAARICTFANVADQTARKSHPNYTWSVDCDDGFAETAPVCSFQRNPWGLCDTVGNVWEWTWDRYSDVYPPGPATNPAGSADRGDNRVLRGGSWSNRPDNARSANRLDWRPSNAVGDVGLRLVLPAVPSER